MQFHQSTLAGFHKIQGVVFGIVLESIDKGQVGNKDLGLSGLQVMTVDFATCIIVEQHLVELCHLYVIT
jgi:hypothetical protein